jgi:hypothetical protein
MIINLPVQKAAVSLLAEQLLLVSRNSSLGRGVIASLAELGEQSYQLT